MKNKGFTLIELLGVMVILAVLTAVVIPGVINFVKSSNEKRDKLIVELVYNAMDLYIKDYNKRFLKVNGTKYNVSLKKLAAKGYIKSELILSSSDEDLIEKKCIEVTYNNGFNYEMKDKCEATHHQIEYDIDSDSFNEENYLSSAATGEELKIKFTDFIPPALAIYYGDDNERLDVSEYTYENGFLIVDNVKVDMKIVYKEKAYLAALSENTYFKEKKYINQIKNIKFLDYVDTGKTYLDRYDLSERQDGSIIGWIDKNYNLYIGSEWDIYSKDLSYAFKDMVNVNNIQFDNLNTSETTNMNNMFDGLSNMTILNLSNFDTSSVTTMHQMFRGMSSLENLNLDTFNTLLVGDMSGMFYGCKSLVSLDLNGFNTEKVTNMRDMFRDMEALTTLTLSNEFNTENVKHFGAMFYHCKSMTNFDFLTNWNTESAEKMFSMFVGCESVTELDLSQWQTENVTSMGSMFDGCSGLTSLNISGFNTSNVEYMALLFQNCSNLTKLNLENFNTLKVKNMSRMFKGCGGIQELDLSNFNTIEVEDMSYMFYDMNSLTSLTLGKDFDTSKVMTMKGMFASIPLSTINISNFNTSNVTDMSYMFYKSINLENLTLGEDFDTSKVTSMKGMFFDTNILESNITFPRAENSDCMFSNSEETDIEIINAMEKEISEDTTND